jgi:hypothetical protein
LPLILPILFLARCQVVILKQKQGYLLAEACHSTGVPEAFALPEKNFKQKP